VGDGTYAWFGFLPTFHRVEAEIMPFMIIAIAVGVVHVMLGLAIGVLNAVKTGTRSISGARRHPHDARRILVLVGVGQLALLSGTGEIAFQLGRRRIAIAGFIYAIRGGGVMGVVETLESFTHIASYIRIMAVGLAGALFADAINQIVSPHGQSRSSASCWASCCTRCTSSWLPSAR
jgi:V/A-type H+/Na+-transporting ATPase subunit I